MGVPYGFGFGFALCAVRFATCFVESVAFAAVATCFVLSAGLACLSVTVVAAVLAGGGDLCCAVAGGVALPCGGVLVGVAWAVSAPAASMMPAMAPSACRAFMGGLLLS